MSPAFAQKTEAHHDEIAGDPYVDELPGGVGDLDLEGPCEQDIRFCSTVQPGGSHLAECIQNQKQDEKEGLISSEFTVNISEKCKADALQYKMKLASNINNDKHRRTVCQADAQKICKSLRLKLVSVTQAE